MSDGSRYRPGVISGGKSGKDGGSKDGKEQTVYWERSWTFQIIWFGIVIAIIGFALWATAYFYTIGSSDVELGFNWETGRIAGLGAILGGPLIFWVIFPLAHQKAWDKDPLLRWLCIFGVITTLTMLYLGYMYADLLIFL